MDSIFQISLTNVLFKILTSFKNNTPLEYNQEKERLKRQAR